jgi:hypothetical protein
MFLQGSLKTTFNFFFKVSLILTIIRIILFVKKYIILPSLFTGPTCINIQWAMLSTFHQQFYIHVHWFILKNSTPSLTFRCQFSYQNKVHHRCVLLTVPGTLHSLFFNIYFHSMWSILICTDQFTTDTLNLGVERSCCTNTYVDHLQV